MEPQKILNCQSNHEKKEQSWRYNPPSLQTVLQSYSNQNSMVLAQKETYGSMEQNRQPRNKPTHLYGQLIFYKEGRNIQWRKKVSSASGIGKAGQPHVNQCSENTPSYHTKNKLKMA